MLQPLVNPFLPVFGHRRPRHKHHPLPERQFGASSVVGGIFSLRWIRCLQFVLKYTQEIILRSWGGDIGLTLSWFDIPAHICNVRKKRHRHIDGKPPPLVLDVKPRWTTHIVRALWYMTWAVIGNTTHIQQLGFILFPKPPNPKRFVLSSKRRQPFLFGWLTDLRVSRTPLYSPFCLKKCAFCGVQRNV